MQAFSRFEASATSPWATSPMAFALWQQAQAGEALKDEAETRIWSVPGGEDDAGTHPPLFLKEYRILPHRRWMASWVRSRSGREWRGLEAMRQAGLPVAPPCFFAELRRGPWLHSSLLATASLGEVLPLPQFLTQANEPSGQEHCQALGRLVRQLHDAGFGHFRLQAKNIMVRIEGQTPESRLALIDAPYSCQWTSGALPERIRRLDLVDLCGAHAVFTAEQREALLQAYDMPSAALFGFLPRKRGRYAQKFRRIAYYLLAIWSGHRP
jgi:hypothetical protein